MSGRTKASSSPNHGSASVSSTRSSVTAATPSYNHGTSVSIKNARTTVTTANPAKSH